jgi:hypothetical protein
LEEDGTQFSLRQFAASPFVPGNDGIFFFFSTGSSVGVNVLIYYAFGFVGIGSDACWGRILLYSLKVELSMYPPILYTLQNHSTFL